MKIMNVALLTAASLIAGCSQAADDEWITLFNGTDLTGWIVKSAGHPAGENPDNVFRAEDGELTVSYDDMEGEFNGRFGHIFYDRPFTNYHFRCEYRFTGDQVPGASKWAHSNSGVMLSGQHPSTMGVKDKFPISLEFQFLAQDASGIRPTGSICTPGTYVDVNGETVTEHVIKSTFPALPMGEWVLAEAIVLDGQIVHKINGKTVLVYSNPKYDDGTPVTHGWISLQSESHPVQFRNIQVKPLD